MPLDRDGWITDGRRAGKVISKIAGELMSNVCRPFSRLMHLSLRLGNEFKVFPFLERLCGC